MFLFVWLLAIWLTVKTITLIGATGNWAFVGLLTPVFGLAVETHLQSLLAQKRIEYAPDPDDSNSYWFRVDGVGGMRRWLVKVGFWQRGHWQ